MEIETKSKNERSVLLVFLLGLGYVWHRGDQNFTDVNDINEAYPFYDYTSIELDKDAKDMWGCGSCTNDYSWPFYDYKSIELDKDAKDMWGCGSCTSDYSWPEDIDKIYAIITNVTNKVELGQVAGYNANIQKDGLHVGCQTISFKEFNDIAAKMSDYQTKFKV